MSIKFKAINLSNILEVEKFEADSVLEARDFVKQNLDKSKSWGIFNDIEFEGDI